MARRDAAPEVSPEQRRMCAFCGRSEATSREHIVLDAFGGKRHVLGLSCVRCNNGLGESIDRPFGEAFREARIFLGHRSGRDGAAPAPKRGLKSRGGKRVILATDGVVEVEIEKAMQARGTDGGGLSVSVEAKNEAELAKLIVNAFSRGDVVGRELQGGTAGPTNHDVGDVEQRMSLGTLVQARSLAKTALAALFAAVGGENVPAEIVADVAAFVVGGPEGERRRYHVDATLRAAVREHLQVQVGEHALFLFNSARTLEVMFLLFGVFPFRFRLADEVLPALSKPIRHHLRPAQREHTVTTWTPPPWWTSFSFENRHTKRNVRAGAAAWDELWDLINEPEAVARRHRAAADRAVREDVLLRCVEDELASRKHVDPAAVLAAVRRLLDKGG